MRYFSSINFMVLYSLRGILALLLPHLDEIHEGSGAFKVPKDDIEEAIEFATRYLGYLERFENAIKTSSKIIPGTPTHGLYMNIEPENIAKQRGNEARLAMKASAQLAYSFCYDEDITLAKCSELIKNLNFKNTSLHNICNYLSRRCNYEEKLNPYRSINGRCNNIDVSSVGESFTAFSRLQKVKYLNYFDTPKRAVSKEALPSARTISSNLVVYDEEHLNDITVAFSQWGIFIADDLTRFASSVMIHIDQSFRCCEESGFILAPRYTHPFCMAINIDAKDEFYWKHHVQCMSYTRSLPALRTDCSFGSLEQQNQATHWLDASHIYGPMLEKSMSLRTKENGTLKTFRVKDPKRENITNDFFPLYSNPTQHCLVSDNDSSCFVSGDNHVNFLPQVAVMRTLWLREHNRIAQKLSEINTEWDDDTVFEETRRLVIAEIQRITYSEWLPILLDKRYLYKMNRTKKYINNIDARVSNEFAVAAIRSIYTMIPNTFSLVDQNNLGTTLRIKNFFMKPEIIIKKFNSLVKGITSEMSKKIGITLAEDLHNYLYADPARYQIHGSDLLSLDIQRGRDHGLRGYNSYRSLCGLKRANKFTDLQDTIPKMQIQKLSKVYEHVDDIDLIIGGLLEKTVGNSLLGPTFSCIITDQFTRTKDGDRYFWFHTNQPKPFNSLQMQEIGKVTLARIICDNSDIGSIQPNVFQKIGVGNTVVNCADDQIPKLNLSHWNNLRQKYSI